MKAKRTAAVGVLAVILFMTFAVQAYNRLVPISSFSPTPAAQGKAPSRGRLHSRLSLQPEADRMRRRLGQRLSVPGREVSVITGTLTIGGKLHTVRIVRTQDEDDERLAIAVDGGATSLTWSGKGGAADAAGPAGGQERSLIERIALDSPDQFVLAQLRGASYYTVTEYAAPPGITDPENYTGPVWKIVRIGEPSGATNKANSRSRLYYVNSRTGLIDKVVSNEGGSAITADISGWVDVAGERVPSRITWTQDGQAVMDLTINSVAHNPRQ